MLFMNHGRALASDMQQKAAVCGIKIRHIRFTDSMGMPRYFAMRKDGVGQLLPHGGQSGNLLNQYIAVTILIWHAAQSDEPVRGRNSKVARHPA